MADVADLSSLTTTVALGAGALADAQLSLVHDGEGGLLLHLDPDGSGPAPAIASGGLTRLAMSHISASGWI